MVWCIDQNAERREPGDLACASFITTEQSLHNQSARVFFSCRCKGNGKCWGILVLAQPSTIVWQELWVNTSAPLHHRWGFSKVWILFLEFPSGIQLGSHSGNLFDNEDFLAAFTSWSHCSNPQLISLGSPSKWSLCAGILILGFTYRRNETKRVGKGKGIWGTGK